MHPSPTIPVAATPRLSVAEYHTLLHSGQLAPEDRLELLDGQLVPKMTIVPPHATAVADVREVLREMLPAGWFLRSQQPVTLTTSEPEPDVAVVQGHRRDFSRRHPGPDEVAVLIEVADSSLAQDRGLKARLYAGAGIGEYWIINLVDRQIEVYSLPTSDAYAQMVVLSEWQSLSLHLGSVQMTMFSVHEVLP